MKVTLIQIDKTSESHIAEGFGIYTKRLKNYLALDIVTINVPKSIRMKSEKEQKSEEAKLILKSLPESAFVVLLDEAGKMLKSTEFTTFLQKKQLESVKNLVFVIGGPYGFDQNLYERSSYKLSLSPMTFSHQMVRLFFIEQLYRACTIQKGEKYHHI